MTDIRTVVIHTHFRPMDARMRRQIQAPKGKDGFPDSPVSASDLLKPITCWSGMVCEARITGVEFDQFWYKSVKEHVAYFFRWLGSPRSTVLVVFSDESLYHLECRTLGDQLVPRMKAEPIITEVVNRFQDAGLWRNRPVIDENVYPECKDRYFLDTYYRRLLRPGDQKATMSDRYHPDVMPQHEEGATGLVVDSECYEDPDYSEAEDRYSDPIAALLETRKIAGEGGLTDEEIDYLFPLPK